MPIVDWTKNSYRTGDYPHSASGKINYWFFIEYRVVLQSFQTFAFTKSIVPARSIANYITRLLVVSIVVLIARSVANFAELYALVSAAFNPFLQCIFPLTFCVQVRSVCNMKKSSCPQQFLHVVMLSVAFLTLTIGVYTSFAEIL